MLDARANRLDYGEQLMPPEGYELDAAIATSYSLDLNALLAIPVALCFRNTLEGDLRGEKLALYEALSQLKGKLKVFYQQGQVHIPREFNRLFALLEPCLQPVVPPDQAFSAFHPKIWLLRYLKRADQRRRDQVCYRLLVLSRNLTFDRSWDLAVSLDGNLGGGKGQSAPWQEFFSDLLQQSPDFDKATTILDELPRIQWQVPEPFHELALLPGGPTYGAPLEPVESSLDSLMVVSPFLRGHFGGTNALQALAREGSPEKRILCSRAEELDAIGVHALTGWDCYAINTNIVEGEEGFAEPEAGSAGECQLQNLHAKLIVRETEADYRWYLGSANATTAALGDGAKPPRNQEFMARLDGTDERLSPQALLDQWLAHNLFLPHEFSPVTETDDETLHIQLREITYALVSARWQLLAEPVGDGSYDIRLDHDLDCSSLLAPLRVYVSLLASPGRAELAQSLHWTRVPLEQLTRFVLIEVEYPLVAGLGGAVEQDQYERTRLLVTAELEIVGGDDRPRALMQSLVNTPERLLQYVRLLLQTQPDKAQWLGMESVQSLKGTGLAEVLDFGEPLFEQLMLAASRHPQVIRRVDDLVRRLRETDIELPPDFAEIWSHFVLENA